MSNFLTRDVLYYTHEIKDMLDSQARLNIKNEVDSL